MIKLANNDSLYRQWRTMQHESLSIWYQYLIREEMGGYIGEKIPRGCSDKVFEELKQLGVWQVIDLRYGYATKVFERRCKVHGIEHFYYPIHNSPDAIAQMLENYNYFCERIDIGNFYMMGVSTGYVALAIYLARTKRQDLRAMSICEYLTRNSKLLRRAMSIIRSMNKKGKVIYEGNDSLKDYFTVAEDRIKDFEKTAYPKKVSYSFIDFNRGFRNGDVVYDITVEKIGVVGYLYPKHLGVWEYNLVIWPYESGSACTLNEVQIKIARYVCRGMKRLPEYVSYPQSLKTSIALLQKMLE